MITNISIPKPKPKAIKVVKKNRVKRPKKEVMRRKLERQADILCKKIVVLRDKFCVCPAPKNGHSDVMQAGHLITRGKESVKFDLRNVSLQCSSCNLLHEHRPERYTSWFVITFGSDEYLKLIADSEEIKKLSTEELNSICEQLEQIHSRQLEDKTFRPRFSQKQILSGEWKNEIQNENKNI